MFKRVLVANRGEIAVRIIRAIHELGAEAVAVYSEADRAALHVRLADCAYPIGPAPAAQSYLNVPAILAAARRGGAEAVHPGYGFLSENPAFARACADAGIVFVGPSPEAMALMGDKVEARRAAVAAGVPVVPGTTEPVRDDASAAAAATDIGYPLLIKAAAGGGGKGMRAVRTPEDLRPALAQARSEAVASFGDGSVYLEKLIVRPRHIEVQLFGNGKGRVVHLGERECSLQRRYQKVVEEAPAPHLPDDVRRRLWAAAVSAAEAVKYAGAGTIEFLFEPSTQQVHFLEMNARLQVEHPVTEAVTGVDLVKAQFRLAAGASLEAALGSASEVQSPKHALSAAEGSKVGARRDDDLGLWTPDVGLHAIEARIYAEDPDNNWFPSTGTLRLVREPGGPGIRVDSGCESGQEVTVHYDPLLAKLIAWGSTRAEALDRLRRAVDEYVLTGVRTTLPFHRWLVRDEAFLGAELSTGFIAERWPAAPSGAAVSGERVRAAALVAAHAFAARRHAAAPTIQTDAAAPGSTGSEWRRVARREALR
ncbi:MAG: ATP-grasp domain-containing protein [Chloroflexi bacterium]|nr:ATP-grasp domain-containing protein [Chloroflexota bacterium]